MGETSVVVTRAEGSNVHAWVNRGALVCRDLHGNTQPHTCVYHQWGFDPKGDLVGVYQSDACRAQSLKAIICLGIEKPTGLWHPDATGKGVAEI